MQTYSRHTNMHTYTHAYIHNHTHKHAYTNEPQHINRDVQIPTDTNTHACPYICSPSSVHPFVHLRIYPSSPSIHLSVDVQLSVYIPIYLLISPTIHLSISPSICLSIFLSDPWLLFVNPLPLMQKKKQLCWAGRCSIRAACLYFPPQCFISLKPYVTGLGKKVQARRCRWRPQVLLW